MKYTVVGEKELQKQLRKFLNSHKQEIQERLTTLCGATKIRIKNAWGQPNMVDDADRWVIVVENKFFFFDQDPAVIFEIQKDHVVILFQPSTPSVDTLKIFFERMLEPFARSQNIKVL